MSGVQGLQDNDIVKITSGSLLARNTLLNFIGQAVPLIVGVITIPFIIRGLGTERFGLLSLVWVILGYFTIFDLGLGRATTKFVAEALGKSNEEQIPRLIWTAVTAQAILGVIGGLVLAGIIPLLVDRILNIPSELISETKSTFYLLAFSVPIILISGSFRGLLEAFQRFDLVNAVGIPASISTYLLTLVGLILGFQLTGIVALILLARFGTLAAFVVLSLRLVPELKRFSGSFSIFLRLFSFGGWITVSSVVGPILTYYDRFLIGALLSISAVAYYTAPFEVISRLWIIPGSLVMALFPAFSTLEGSKNKERLGVLFARSIKYILLALGVIVLVIGLFAKNILRIWLGADFSAGSTLVLQILALGVLVNSLANIPYALLQGVGRPDLPAKFHLLELPIYVGIAWLLISKWEIAGAAVASTLRVSLDAFLLFIAAFKVYKFSPRLLAANGVPLVSLSFLLFVGMAYGVKCLTNTLPLFIPSILFVALFGLFVWVVWEKFLDPSDKCAILKVVKLWQKTKSMP